MADRQARLEDVFLKEIIPRFYSKQSFVTFALSTHGLKLDFDVVTPIEENNRGNVTKLKLCLLGEWTTLQGSRATPDLIRATVERYFQQQSGGVVEPLEQMGMVHEVQIEQEETQIRFTNRDPNDPSTLNVTNIYGDIQGNVAMGNERVLFGGNGAGSAQQIDPDVPKLKPSKSEISTEKTDINIGGCFLTFSPHSVKAATKHEMSYDVCVVQPPAGYIHASSTLSCAPAYQGQKNAQIILPTWCSTDASVSATIYVTTDAGDWQDLDMPILTHEGHLELHYRQLDNITAFISRDRLPDIQFKISCFLYNNANAEFAMGFCLADKAIENVFLHGLKKNGYVCTVKNLDPLFAMIGDEIQFNITGQVMQNTHIVVDEQFVSTFKGHISVCNPENQAPNPVYRITQKRQGDPENQPDGLTVFEKTYDINGRQNPLTEPAGATGQDRPQTTVNILGNIEADTYISNTGEVEIDNRKFVDGAGRPTGEESKLSYEEKRDRASKKQKKKDAKKSGGGSKSRAEVTIHGKIKAGTVITGSDSVRINNQTILGKKSEKQDEQKIEKIIEPVQVDEQEPQSEQQDQHTEGPQPPVLAEPTSTDCTTGGNNTPAPVEESTSQTHQPLPEFDVQRDKDLRRRRQLEQQNRQDDPEDQQDPPKLKRKKWDKVSMCIAMATVVCLALVMYSYTNV